MSPYDSWNTIEDSDSDLEDDLNIPQNRDVILFCIDASSSMQSPFDSPIYQDVQTTRLASCLEAVISVGRKKVVVGPNDCMGVILFNTTKTNEKNKGSRTSEIKPGCYVLQPITPISAPNIQLLIQLLQDAQEDPQTLHTLYPPTSTQTPLGDVFTSCNWVIRDGAPKTASKRVFLMTDEDDPHKALLGRGNEKLLGPARTTLVDLAQAGVSVEPFFISTPENTFDPTKFYSSILLQSLDSDDSDDNPSDLQSSLSITRISDLLSQMRFHEVPKRAQFSIGLELGDGFVVSVKGYGLVTEQKKGSYKYFVDLGDRMQVASSRTVYLDEEHQAEVDKSGMLYGMSLGASASTAEDGGEEEGGGEGEFGVRVVDVHKRTFYTSDEIKSFRTLDLEPGIKLLGFKSSSELLFEDNIKHAMFIYPDEMAYSGSKRTFSALLNSMLSQSKIAIVRTLFRRNSTPMFCAMIPQEEKVEEEGWNEPPGFHLIPLPYADDLRAAPIDRAERASDEIKTVAEKWISKLCVKNGTYPPDSYPNPALAYHNAQLEASAFREEFDPESFEDLTLPKVDVIHKRVGPMLKEWKDLLRKDSSANKVIITTGAKRKADVPVDEAEMRSKYEDGTLAKLKVDQIKNFLRSKSLSATGNKAVLLERVAEWIDAH